MLFSLEVRRARKGDCLLLHYGSTDDPRLVLIDGGPARVFEDFLEPRLDEMASARQGALPIDLVMVSHIDDDHINGILDLTAKLKKAKRRHNPLPYEVQVLWHNSFDDVIGNRPEELVAALHENFGTASTAGEPGRIETDDADLAAVLASINQGRTLRDDAKFLDILVNEPFGGLVVARGDDSSEAELDGGAKLTVVGPLQAELAELQAEHDKWLEKKGLGEPAPVTSALAAYEDKSAANLSSIVVMAEANGRSILLTGDARGDKILDGLRRARFLTSGGGLHVDVLKVPHHGSDRNMEQGFFKTVTADHYVFSGNGEHGNPERATFEMLFNARPQGGFAIHLTYPIAEIDAGREKEARKQGKSWSAAENGLASLFDKARNDGTDFTLHIADKKAGSVIDLGEELPV